MKREGMDTPKKEGKGNQHKRAGLEFVPLDAEKAPRGKPRYRDPNNPFNTWVGRGSGLTG